MKQLRKTRHSSFPRRRESRAPQVNFAIAAPGSRLRGIDGQGGAHA